MSLRSAYPQKHGLSGVASGSKKPLFAVQSPSCQPTLRAPAEASAGCLNDCNSEQLLLANGPLGEIDSYRLHVGRAALITAV